jgi:hypothetical protein
MKKLILSVTALGACSLGAFGQGAVYFDSTGSANGTVSINGVLDAGTQAINATLLASTTATGTFTPIAQLLLSSNNTASNDGNVGFDSTDILSAAGDVKASGKIQDQSVNAYLTANATTYFFEVQGWLGNGVSFANATTSGTTAVFSQTLPVPTSPALQGLTSMPALNLVTTAVPEPSTLAMSGVGLASMLIFRRRNK